MVTELREGTHGDTHGWACLMKEQTHPRVGVSYEGTDTPMCGRVLLRHTHGWVCIVKEQTHPRLGVS